ncbi:MAG: aminopeptidase P family protein, partial [bacterium]|nr:aminopeptidase P family protein [bacterium]
MDTPLFRLKKLIKKDKLDGVLISSVPNIIYLTNYSGFSKEEREAFLFVTENKQYILTDGRYTQAVKKLIPDFELIEISGKNPFEKIFKALITKHKIKKIGFEGNNLSFLEHKAFKKYFSNIYHLSLSYLRIIKTPQEISKIKKACELGDKAFDYVLKKIKLGVSEKELAFEIEFFIKKNGGDLSFPSIVAFGINSAIPHHQTSDKRLATSDKLVLLDFGVKLDNYCSDMTRTVFFGKPTKEQRKMYETVLAAQQKSIDTLNSLFMIHNSIPAKRIDKAARDYIISKGYKTIPHSVGHGIGIEVHEAPHLSPKSKDILKEGMVFSIEPGIYIPGFGGVRIED